MAPQSIKRKWDDLKIMAAAVAVTATIWLWNVFATPNEGTTVPPVTDTPIPEVADMTDTAQPTIIQTVQPTADITAQPLAESTAPPELQGKILLGGSAPIPKVVVVQPRGNQSGNSQPAPSTQTRSS